MRLWGDGAPAGIGSSVEEEAARYCRWITTRAQSNFSSSFWILSPLQRRAMEAVYAFCRVVDDVVDRPGVEAPEAQVQLDRWRVELAAAEQGAPTHPITQALRPVWDRFGVPPAYCEKLIRGVEMDLHRRMIQTFEELKVYCEHVASAVGLISVRVFGCRHPSTDRYATALGIAFQLTNILRDIRADARAGRFYLPLEDLDRFGVRPQDLAEGGPGPAFRELMAFECGRARSYFSQAEEAMAEGGEARRLMPARIMGAVYRRLLGRIEEREYDVFTQRIRIPRARQIWIGLRCLWS